MREATANGLAVVAIVLLLAGVNDHNPHQWWCLAAAGLLAAISTYLWRTP